jgi:hypothetical protein
MARWRAMEKLGPSFSANLSIVAIRVSTDIESAISGFATQGGLIAYRIDTVDLFQRSASYAEQRADIHHSLSDFPHPVMADAPFAAVGVAEQP